MIFVDKALVLLTAMSVRKISLQNYSLK